MARAPASRAASTIYWAFPRTPTTRSMPLSPATRPHSRCKAADCGPSSNISPATRMRRLAGMDGKSRDHGFERFRIGVVAVIDDRGVADVQHLAALVRRLQPAGGGDAIGQRNARFDAGRNRCHHVPDVMPAKERQRHRCLLCAGRDVKPHTRCAKLLDLFCAGIGARTHAEIDRAPVKVAPELPHIRVVAIEDCDAGSGQALYQLIFSARDAQPRHQENSGHEHYRRW